MSSTTSPVTISRIKQEYKRQALDDARRLNLPVTEPMLNYFINAIQRSHSVTIRKVSKAEAILLVYVSQTRYYVRYNNKYKLIVGFHSEEDARYNRYDLVNVIINPQIELFVQGQIVFVLKAFANPRSYLQYFRKYNVSAITSSKEVSRPQYSYLVRIAEDGVDKIIWPPSGNLRKISSSNGAHG